MSPPPFHHRLEEANNLVADKESILSRIHGAKRWFHESIKH